MTRLFLLLPALALANCVSVLPKPAPAPDVYTLSFQADDAPSAPLNGQPIVVSIEPPNMSRLEAGANIVWRMTDGRLAIQPGVEWAGPSPVLLQGLATEAIDRTGAGKVIAIRDAAGIAGAFELLWDVRAFHAVDAGEQALNAEIVFAAKLIDRRSRIIIGAQTFRKTAPLGARTGAAAAEALSAAARNAAMALGAWASALAQAPLRRRRQRVDLGARRVIQKPSALTNRGDHGLPLQRHPSAIARVDRQISGAVL